MSNLLVLNNLHLGVDLLGAIVFFIIALLFFQAYEIKKDFFSLVRTIGFGILSLWQVFSALGGSSSVIVTLGLIIYCVGLICVLLSYAIEKLPERPMFAMAALPLFNITTHFNLLPTIFLVIITALFIRQYYADINKLLKWMIVGFLFLSAASFVANFTAAGSFDMLWILEYLLKLAAFIALLVWVWKFLSFRMREEMLIAFVFNGLIMALLIITTFSTFFLKSLEDQTLTKLGSNEQLFSFYIDSLENKALSTSQIIGNNVDFAAAANAHDTVDLERIGNELTQTGGTDFFIVAARDGSVFYKNNFPIASGENMIRQSVGQDALEGKSNVTIDDEGTEGLSIRAASPILYNGKIVGAVMTGYLLNKNFAESVKKIVGFETSLFIKQKAIASSILLPGTVVARSQEEFRGTTQFAGETTIADFSNIKNHEGETVAAVAFSTTPGTLLQSAQSTSASTMLIITLVILGLILPLYRFTVYITR